MKKRGEVQQDGIRASLWRPGCDVGGDLAEACDTTDSWLHRAISGELERGRSCGKTLFFSLFSLLPPSTRRPPIVAAHTLIPGGCG